MGSSRGDAASTRAIVEEALAEYRARFTSERWQTYLTIHDERYRILVPRVLELLSTLSQAADGRYRILDIGPRFEVDLLHRLLPDARVDTLGIDAGLFPLRGADGFVEFDLQRVADQNARPALGPYDLVILAEVIEHLNVAPSKLLPWLASLVEPGGYLLLQTPNAVALPKRLRMLVGIHPFMPLTDVPSPGHVREYTVSELVREGRDAGLAVVDVRTANYFGSGKLTNRIYQRLEPLMPGTLRAGITVAYRVPKQSG